MNYKLTITFIITLCATNNMISETHPIIPHVGDVEIILGDKNANTDSVYQKLVDNAPVEPMYTNLPRFAIVGNENKFYMSLGAKINATSSFDWGNPLTDSPSDFTVSDITKAKAGNGALFQSTVKNSQFYLNIVALPGTQNQMGLFLAVKFSGDNNTYGATLQHAYVKYRGFSIGYKSTLYSDGASFPITIDSEGPNSSPNISNTGIAFEQQFNRFSAGIGAEIPIYSITSINTNEIINSQDGNYSNKISQRIPDIPIYLQYSHKNGHTRISSIFRTLQYRNIDENKNTTQIGWGLKLSGYTIVDKFTFYYMAQIGKGIASYIQDNTDKGLDMVPSGDNPGEETITESFGAYGAVQYAFSKKIFATAIYSFVRNNIKEYNGGAIKYADQYK